MSLLVKANKHITSGNVVTVRPEAVGQYVGFSLERLVENEGYTHPIQHEREVCIVILTGIVDVTVNGVKHDKLGLRMSVFEDLPPVAVYAPASVQIDIHAHTDADVALCSAPDVVKNLPARLITGQCMAQSVRGQGSNTRYVTDVLPQTEPAQSLLVVEVKTPAGHSSSYPPHKHDRAAIPEESILEETYYHQVNPPQGFVFQRVYTDERDIDESHAVENHDVMMVPRGYHPVVAPHGYDSYYLNVMAGPVREWHFKNDPAHEWMLASK
jgi:5-deoxy-glucuronate isomerase